LGEDFVDFLVSGFFSVLAIEDAELFVLQTDATEAKRTMV
jgi:hypothetical protein